LPSASFWVWALLRALIRTLSGRSVACIAGLSMRQASAQLAQTVSPPQGGTSTERRIVMPGGCGRNGESVCQPDPNSPFER